MARPFYVPRESPPFMDANNDNAITWIRNSTSEQNTYTVDIAGMLDSGETCSSVTTKDSWGLTFGTVTVTSAGVISVPTTAGGNGGTIVLVTTSASRVLPVKLAWKAQYNISSADDYA